jgi:hypothetical protein
MLVIELRRNNAKKAGANMNFLSKVYIELTERNPYVWAHFLIALFSCHILIFFAIPTYTPESVETALYIFINTIGLWYEFYQFRQMQNRFKYRGDKNRSVIANSDYFEARKRQLIDAAEDVAANNLAVWIACFLLV